MSTVAHATFFIVGAVFLNISLHFCNSQTQLQNAKKTANKYRIQIQLTELESLSSTIQRTYVIGDAIK